MLSWSASASPAVTAYRVYHGTTSRSYSQERGAGVDAGFNTSYTFTGLRGGQTYYFAVTAVDATGNESEYSNEAAKLVP